ncbi:MAG: ABC transporter permease [Bacteroidales bacterium]
MILFKREYRAAVKTKSFLISLLLVPILMGGSFIVLILTEDKIDTEDKKVVIIDHTGTLEKPMTAAAEIRYKNEIYDEESGEQVRPKYVIEFLEPNISNPFDQQLQLSDRVRSKELHAFIEVGKGMMNPAENRETAYIRYYSEHSFNDNVRNWFNNAINNNLREFRIADLNLDPKLKENIFNWTFMEGMGLVEMNQKTGKVKEAEKSNELQSFLVPYIIILLMFMLTMMSAVPLLTAVMEEKSEKIAEVLLANVTPFEFMMGKVLGGLGISLTIAVLYIIGGIVIARQTGNTGVIPFDILPWFFAYSFLYIIMVGSGMAALGSTCNDNKDAQTLQFPAMMAVIIPLFVLFPVLQDPSGSLATTLSLIPPFTPPLMMIRLATPVTIPLWQPLVGIVLVILFTLFTVWVGARIFRTAILIQGQKPTFMNIFRYALGRK